MPGTYLKHFSINDNGKNLYVINFRDKFQNKVYRRNIGDSCFWIENYYDSNQFKNKKSLEILFNRLIENNYDQIVSEIKKEKPIDSQWVKDKLLIFIYFSLFRSPGRRDEFEQLLRINNWCNKIKSRGRANKIEGESNKAYFIKELHLNEMVNKDKRYKNIDSICTNLGVKKWSIIIAPENSYWITSDDPCVEIKFDQKLAPTAFKRWDFQELESMYLPITKKYCLLIDSYDKEDDVKLNLNTDTIKYKNASKKDILLFNRFSFATMNKILVSPNEMTFTELAYELY